MPDLSSAAGNKNIVLKQVVTVPGTKAVSGVVDNVVFDADVAGSLIEINSTAQWPMPVDVMDKIVPQHRTWRHSQHIDAASVIHHAHEVVNVIVFDDVVLRSIRGAAPVPSDRDARIARVEDFVVNNSVTAAVSCPNRDRTQVDMPGVVNEVVTHKRTADFFGVCVRRNGAANPDSAGSKIV